jgi:hypothetical protein
MSVITGELRGEQAASEGLISPLASPHTTYEQMATTQGENLPNQG